MNLSLDDDILNNLHLFMNANFEKAFFAHYVTSGTSYDGLPVSNVPDKTFNLGLSNRYFPESALLKPRIWSSYTGTQAMFNNNTGAPSAYKMPAFSMLNLDMNTEIPTHHAVPLLKRVDLGLDILNLTNNHYNEFACISSGCLLGMTPRSRCWPCQAPR